MEIPGKGTDTGVRSVNAEPPLKKAYESADLVTGEGVRKLLGEMMKTGGNFFVYQRDEKPEEEPKK